MTGVSIKNVKKSYADVEVIHDLSVEIISGEFLVFVGPSGCGKSTLLRMIAGLEGFEQGQIFINEKLVNQLHPSKRDIAMVFQDYALYPHMSVRKNMGFGLKMRGFSPQDIESSIKRVASILQIEHLLNRKPRELSGGQRQRVAMGRAIVRNPQVFLFDEPLSNLDAKLRVDMRSEIKALHQRLKTTSIYVTHDQVEAMTMADRIVVLNKGKIEQIGTPLELYHKPVSHFVAGFLGSPPMNFIPAQVDAERIDLFNKFNLMCTSLYSGSAIVGIRPEAIKISSALNSGYLVGSIFLIEPLGSDTLFTVLVGVERIIVRSTENINLNLHDPVSLSWNLKDQHLFDAYSGKRVE